jgi:hypothetical protein
MAIQLNDYFLSGLLDLVFDRIESLRQKYISVPLMNIVTDVAQEYICSLYMEPISRYEQINKYIKHQRFSLKMQQEMLQMFTQLEPIKAQLEASDYFILKSLLDEDDNRSKHYLDLAKMACPEDYLFFLLSLAGEDIFELFKNLLSETENWPVIYEKGEAKKYISMLILVSRIKKNPSKDHTCHLKKLIQLDKRYEGLVYLLLYEMVQNEDNLFISRMIGNLTISMNWFPQFQLIKVSFLYKTGKYRLAYQLIKELELDSIPLNADDWLEFNHLKAKLYSLNDQKGLSILMWKEIVFDEYTKSQGSDYYFEALLCLASIYADSKNLSDAKRTLQNVGPLFNWRYLIERFEADYYALRGKILMVEKNTQKAILNFKSPYY